MSGNIQYIYFLTLVDRAIDHKFPKMYLTYFDVFTINLGQMVLGNTVLTSQVPQPTFLEHLTFMLD